jgi:hypothetical protein
MAKSHQITTRGSAATVACLLKVLPVAGSPHRRPRFLSLRGQGELSLNFVRPRNKVAGSWIIGLACTFAEGRPVVTALAYRFEGLRPFVDELQPGEWPLA